MFNIESMISLEKLASIFNTLGTFDNSLFSGRLIFQKTIFILKELGLNSDISFSMYRNGPYNSELATLGYELEKRNITTFSIDLDTKELRLIERFKSIIKSNEKNSIFYEMLADMIYFLKYYRYDKNKIFDELKNKHDYLANAVLFETCWEIINREGITASS